MLRFHEASCFIVVVAYNPSGLQKKKKPENYVVKITIPLARRRKKNVNEFHRNVFIHAIR